MRAPRVSALVDEPWGVLFFRTFLLDKQKKGTCRPVSHRHQLATVLFLKHRPLTFRAWRDMPRFVKVDLLATGVTHQRAGTGDFAGMPFPLFGLFLPKL